MIKMSPTLVSAELGNIEVLFKRDLVFKEVADEMHCLPSGLGSGEGQQLDSDFYYDFCILTCFVNESSLISFSSLCISCVSIFYSHRVTGVDVNHVVDFKALVYSAFFSTCVIECEAASLLLKHLFL